MNSTSGNLGSAAHVIKHIVPGRYIGRDERRLRPPQCSGAVSVSFLSSVTLHGIAKNGMEVVGKRRFGDGVEHGTTYQCSHRGFYLGALSVDRVMDGLQCIEGKHVPKYEGCTQHLKLLRFDPGEDFSQHEG